MIKYSEKYFLQFDSQVKSFITWSFLFRIGLSLDDAKQKLQEKYYYLVRFKFSDCYDSDDFFNKLIKHQFEPSFAKTLTDKVFSENINIEMFDEFVNEFKQIMSHRNHDLEYFLSKGWSQKQSQDKLKDFFRLGMKSIQQKREESDEYNENFIKSRLPGAYKPKNYSKQSKFELMLLDEFLKNFASVKTNFYSPCLDNYLIKMKNKKNFQHDFFVDDHFIIEYNGIYFHKDIDLEIVKAYNCIYKSGRNEKFPYILLWEKDFDTIEEYVDFVKECMYQYEQTGTLFFSTRQHDQKLFVKYFEEKTQEEKYHFVFRDTVLNFKTKSHCSRLQVACIAVKNGRIIATGINGTPKGMINCDEYFYNYYNENINQNNISFDDWKQTKEYLDMHHEWSNINETHAEQSMVGYCAKHGISLKDAIIYSTTQPCIHCTKLLTTTGIKKIIYIEEYFRTDPHSENLFINADIEPYFLKTNI